MGQEDATPQSIVEAVDRLLGLREGLQNGPNPRRLQAVQQAGPLCREMLERVKGCAPTLCDEAAEMAKRAAAALPYGADFPENALRTLRSKAERIPNVTLSDYEVGEAQTQHEDFIQEMRSELERTLRELANMQGSTDASRAAHSAAQAIAQSTATLVGSALEQQAKCRTKQQREWQLELQRLAREVSRALQDLALSVAALVQNPHDPNAWNRLIQSSENVKSATLKFITHIRSRYQDPKQTESLEMAYKSVVAAIKLLIDSVEEYQTYSQEMGQAFQAFDEDRTEILEKRALVHRLDSQVHRKRNSLEVLLSK